MQTLSDLCKRKLWMLVMSMRTVQRERKREREFCCRSENVAATVHRIRFLT